MNNGPPGIGIRGKDRAYEVSLVLGELPTVRKRTLLLALPSNSQIRHALRLGSSALVWGR